MASFEQRLDAQGRPTAIRAKVRRVGMPHLSQTFRVQGRGVRALRAARRAAEQWAEEIETAWQAGTTPSPHSGALVQAWRHAARGPHEHGAAQRRASEEASATAGRFAEQLLALDARTRGLVVFALETGMPAEALAALRWQQVQMAERRVVCVSPSGQRIEHCPLSTAALEALLQMKTRKYGPVFGLDAAGVQAALDSFAPVGRGVHRPSATRKPRSGRP